MHNIYMRCFFIIFSIFFLNLLIAQDENVPPILLGKDALDTVESQFDSSYNYARFYGRISDNDNNKKVFKIWSENGLVRLLTSGDVLFFYVGTQDTGLTCKAKVLASEEHFFTIEVFDFNPCLKDASISYLRKGTVLLFDSHVLYSKVSTSNKYHYRLVDRRRDYFSQLAQINNFLFNYDQERVRLAQDYDQRIQDLLKEKQLSLANLSERRVEDYKLQRKLLLELDKLEKEIGYHRIEKIELRADRFEKFQEEIESSLPGKNAKNTEKEERLAFESSRYDLSERSQRENFYRNEDNIDTDLNQLENSQVNEKSELHDEINF